MEIQCSIRVGKARGFDWYLVMPGIRDIRQCPCTPPPPETSLKILDHSGTPHHPSSMKFEDFIDVLGQRNVFFFSYLEAAFSLFYFSAHSPVHTCQSSYAPESLRGTGKGLISEEKRTEIA